MVVDNNVINDSIQQTTQFPPSFPQTIVSAVSVSKCVFKILNLFCLKLIYLYVFESF
jgi:hypothetical protein